MNKSIRFFIVGIAVLSLWANLCFSDEDMVPLRNLSVILTPYISSQDRFNISEHAEVARKVDATGIDLATIDRVQEGSINVWTIRKPAQETAQYCGVIYVTVEECVGGHIVGDLNYFIHPECRRKHLALEAGRLVVNHMLRSSRRPLVTELSAKVRDVDAVSSGGVLEKLGFNKKKYRPEVTNTGEKGSYWELLPSWLGQS